jgi:hypothetical protein
MKNFTFLVILMVYLNLDAYILDVSYFEAIILTGFN